MNRTILMAGVLAVLSLFGLAPAQASSVRVTKGDAEAVFQAYGYAGRNIRDREGIGAVGVFPGAPADSELRASIRPFAGTIFDGRHYCAEDWHVILSADIEPGLGYQEAKAIIDQVEKEFFLDGAPLATTRTAVKRLFVPGGDEGYYANFGSVLSPSALTVGSHTVKVIETGPYAGTDEVTIFIDAPGTGVCP